MICSFRGYTLKYEIYSFRDYKRIIFGSDYISLHKIWLQKLAPIIFLVLAPIHFWPKFITYANTNMSPHLKKKRTLYLSKSLCFFLSQYQRVTSDSSSDQNPHGLHRTTCESSLPTTTRVKSPPLVLLLWLVLD